MPASRLPALSAARMRMSCGSPEWLRGVCTRECPKRYVELSRCRCVGGGWRLATGGVPRRAGQSRSDDDSSGGGLVTLTEPFVTQRDETDPRPWQVLAG